MGVAAAEFHEVVAAVRIGLGADGGGQTCSHLAVAEFVDVFHQRLTGRRRAAPAKVGEERQGFGRLRRVEVCSA